jgi:hypothetical protein
MDFPASPQVLSGTPITAASATRGHRVHLREGHRSALGYKRRRAAAAESLRARQIRQAGHALEFDHRVSARWSYGGAEHKKRISPMALLLFIMRGFFGHPIRHAATR